MTTQKFENLWNLLSKRKFDLNNLISDDISCIDCKGILINAHQAPCGCKFCHKCIENYIATENQYCPGDKEECTEEIISKQTNVSQDYRTNNMISKLKLKCPNKICDYECELRHLDEHLQSCDKQIESDSLLEMKTPHMVNGDNKLVDTINNLMNAVNRLKENEESNRNEIDKLKDSLVQMKDECCKTVERDLGNIRMDMEKLKVDDEKKREEMANEKINGKDQCIIANLKESLRQREVEIGLVNRESEMMKKEYCQELKSQMKVYMDEMVVNFVEEMKSLYEQQVEKMMSSSAGTCVVHQFSSMESEITQSEMPSNLHDKIDTDPLDL